ncbi:hypothetical protein ED733_001356 [Metarhizium rileyi]|uniref:SMP domain-containing protein n=1 Tax=Metarhizium rileyi (strain RCEF 4871) TaxID=1649241 RepID=A0A5C6GGI0_METRR|nr:hypothetical protein ED733_001356 [Metarhizium rileyi]
MPAQMTKDDSMRVQSGQAKNGQDMGSSGFAARAQSAGDKHQNQGGSSGQDGNGSGSGGKAGANK